MQIRAPLTASLALTLGFAACEDDAGGDSPGTSAATASGTQTAGDDGGDGGSADGGGGDDDQSSSGDGSGDDTSGTSAGDDGASSASETGSFIDQPDGGTESMCDPLPIDDCPDGEKCTFYTDAANPSGANKCVPIMGMDQPGDPCQLNDVDYTDNCDIHMLCWGSTAEEDGICIEFCDTNTMCPEGAPCTITNDGALPMCLPTCHPLAPDCPAGWACYDDPSGGWFCDRDASADTGAHGDACEFINACDPGLICLDSAAVDGAGCAGSTGCCGVVCDLSAPAPCPGATEECASYYDDPAMAPPEFMDVGVCVIPQAPDTGRSTASPWKVDAPTQRG